MPAFVNGVEISDHAINAELQYHPAGSVEGWMATLYHRVPLLSPGLKRIGYGQELHPLRGWVTVMELSSSR